MSSFASKEEGSADREASLTATLPNLDHFRMADAAKVYEPAEDTFLLCDALWQDRDFIFHINPIIALEIGSGSGCVITYLTQLLASRQQHCLCLATDVNPHALAITQRTAKANEVILDSIGTDLVQHVEERLHQQIDILIFNPPYVPTDSEEIRKS